MASIRNRAIAAGFLHALHDPDVLAKWQAAKNDSASLRALIADTLGLAQAPSEADLNEMKTHSEASLQKEHQELIKAQSGAPHAVGEGFTVQS